MVHSRLFRFCLTQGLSDDCSCRMKWSCRVVFFNQILAAPLAPSALYCFQSKLFICFAISWINCLSSADYQGAHRAHRACLHRAQLHQQLWLQPLRPVRWCAAVTFGTVASVQAGAGAWTLRWQATVASAEPLRSVSGVSKNGILDC